MSRILRVLLALVILAQLFIPPAFAQSGAVVAGRVVGGIVGITTCSKRKVLCGAAAAAIGGYVVGNEINKWKESRSRPGIGHNNPPREEEPRSPEPTPPPRIPPLPWIPKSTNERQDTSSAVNRAQTNAKLSLEQAGLIDRNGNLTEFAKSNSELVTPGKELQNRRVVETLTSDGSNIGDWSKRKTKSVSLSYGGSVQIHFYQNMLTGKVDQSIDYKIKGDMPTGVERH